MASSTEPLTAGDVVKYEGDQHFSRQSFLATSGETLNCGYICEPGAAGKKIRLATAANADSICLQNLGTLTADTEAVFLVRHAVVDGDRLDYNSQLVATVDAALLDEEIVVRNEPATLDTQTT